VLAGGPAAGGGTAGAVLGTAQRAGSAIGIAVTGTVLFGTLRVGSGPDAVAVAFSHSAQLALLVNVAFVLVALVLVIALPRQAAGSRR